MDAGTPCRRRFQISEQGTLYNVGTAEKKLDFGFAYWNISYN